jgi:hypothetical protein
MRSTFYFFIHSPYSNNVGNASVQEGDAHWYHMMLHLNDTRCVPREANGGATATKADCIAEFGPPTA